MIRHLSFASEGELKALLVKDVPSDVYCSNGFYRMPTAPMQEKGWLGASLIFDIDAKDLDLPCIPEHTYSLCQQCDGAREKAKSGSKCERCNGSKLVNILVPCTKCIQASKDQVKRLNNYLIEDIGIEKEDAAIYFSGNNGFHVHVSNSSFELLDSFARTDLAGYLLGNGIIPESFGVIKGTRGGHSIRFRKSTLSHGWRHRIAKKLNLESATRLENLVEKLGGYSAFKDRVREIATEISVKIDPQVTSDIHRIFRLPGSLNSKSGFAKILCPDLETFDPFNDACLLGDDSILIDVKFPIKLRLRNRTFKISKEKAELPGYVAAYLLCKGIAEAS